MKERERRGMLVFFKKLPKSFNFIWKGPNYKKLTNLNPQFANNSETCQANTLKGTIWQKKPKKKCKPANSISFHSTRKYMKNEKIEHGIDSKKIKKG